MPIGLLIVVSMIAGVAGALSGMGGGIVLIPLLTLSGVDIKRATALSVLSMVLISHSAASIYVKRHLPNLRIAGFAEVYAVIGAIVGALIAVVAAQRVLFGLCGMAFLSCSLLLWKQRRSDWQPVMTQDAYSRQLGWEGSYYDPAVFRTISYHGARAALAGPLLGGAGFLSGLLGVGGSALTVLINDLVIGLPPKVSVTTSNLVIGVMGLASTEVYLEAGLLEPRLVAAVILGVPLGALLGSRLLIYRTNRTVRLIFLCGLSVSAVEMFLRAMGMLR